MAVVRESLRMICTAAAIWGCSGLLSTNVMAQTRPTAELGTNARDSSSSHISKYAFGASVGFLGYGANTTDEFLVAGLHWTPIRPRTFGVEFALGTLPHLLFSGELNVGTRLNGGFVIPISSEMMLFPSVGVSGFGVPDFGVHFAGNGGLGLIVGRPGNIGFRSSITLHHFRETNGVVWLAEIGLIRLPRR